MIKAVKGTRDILPPSSAVWNQVEAVAREVFRIYNYQEIRTPILEETALFARGVGQETDIVSKEMYTFDDRDGSSLTLRPEATASVMRAYIEHRLDQKPGLQKLYYIGPMFRRERPQKGRYRQFYQIGAEAIGSESPMVDAEVIEMVIDLIRRAGLEGFELLINSVGDQNCRPQYVALLKEKLSGSGVAPVRRLPAPRGNQSAARAGLQGARRSGHHQRAAVHPGSFVRSVPHALQRREIAAGRSRNLRMRSARAWCAAWITTCARRLRSCMVPSARRIRCWAAAVTMGWPNRSDRACLRRASDFPSAKTGW